ncbi:MAG: type II secretion system F family protein [Gemmataceae bacterium]|nr:type II secretion system F family protein [Gemmataceae bacterium]MDW8264065.1 type II secretion system F family protein [Gemmataceae bacterium]
MIPALILVGCLGAAAVLIGRWRRLQLREEARARLAMSASADQAPVSPAEPTPFVRPRHLVPWTLGALLFAVGYFGLEISLALSAMAGAIVGLLGGQFETWRVDRARFRLESQLADAIDLMVAALRAGSGTLGALESAARESKTPLRPQLEEMLGRIRFGDDPQAVLRTLERRVPLETVRLFSSALSVHWETGGSLAPTLATVGRVIRDRIAVTRRIRALTMQARASTYAVLGVTYLIGVIIWRNDPKRMEMFLATTVGQTAVAVAVCLQAVGMIWAAALSRLKY